MTMSDQLKFYDCIPHYRTKILLEIMIINVITVKYLGLWNRITQHCMA